MANISNVTTMQLHLCSRQQLLPFQQVGSGNVLRSAPCGVISNFAACIVSSKTLNEIITIRRIGILRKRELSSSVTKRLAARAPVLAIGSQEASTPTVVVQEVEFTWKGQGSEVLLTGDFLNWEKKLALEKRSKDVFSLKQKLALGKYLYKFIVDGEWKHSPDSPIVPDGIGGFNNEVIVADQTTIKDLPNAAKAQLPRPTNSVKPGAVTKPAEASESGEAVRSPTESAEKPAKPIPKPAEASESDEAVRSPIASDEKPAKAIPKPVEASESGEAVRRPTASAEKPAKAILKKVSLQEMMSDSIIPLLSSSLRKEADITDIDISFEDNQLKTSFAKGDIPYCFWAFFPDGILEGSRGSSLTSHGSPPSTIEPFLVDEKKITPELVVFWIKKRLFAQKILSMN